MLSANAAAVPVGSFARNSCTGSKLPENEIHENATPARVAKHQRIFPLPKFRKPLLGSGCGLGLWVSSNDIFQGFTCGLDVFQFDLAVGH